MRCALPREAGIHAQETLPAHDGAQVAGSVGSPGPATVTGTAGVTGTESESRVHGTPVGNFNIDPEPKQLLILRVHPLLP